MKYVALALLFASNVVLAHDVTVDECKYYAGAAKGISDARNEGIPITALLPEAIDYFSTCGEKCGIKDSEDMKRILDFIRSVYSLDIPEGKAIDSDAVAAHVMDECVKAANDRASGHKPLTPDPGVGAKGPQIEG